MILALNYFRIWFGLKLGKKRERVAWKGNNKSTLLPLNNIFSVVSVKNWIKKLKNGKKILKLDGNTSVQCTLQKLVLGNSGQKLCKSRCQSFLSVSNFAWFYYFFLNILHVIVGFAKTRFLSNQILPDGELDHYIQQRIFNIFLLISKLFLP